jgi:hypothetical protein
VKDLLGEKKIRKRSLGRVRSSVSASLQWLCPSTREEEEVIDSHNPNSLMVAELVRIYPNHSSNGISGPIKVKCCIEYNTFELAFHALIFAKNGIFPALNIPPTVAVDGCSCGNGWTYSKETWIVYLVRSFSDEGDLAR